MAVALMCICCTIVHIPSIILRYIPFREELSKKQRTILLIIYTVALGINAGLYYAAFLSGKITIAFYKVNVLTFCMLMAMVNSIVIRKRNAEHLFTFGLTAIVIYMLMALSAFVESKMALSDVVWQITLNAAALCVLFTLLYPLLRRLMVGTITPFLYADSHEYWKNIWFIPVAMMFASILSSPMGEYVKTPLQLVSRLLIGMATLFICRSMSYDYLQLQKREELSQSLNRQKEYYLALSDKVEEARRSRHDFKHHVLAIRTLAGKNETEEVVRYCDGLLNTGAAEPFIPFTGNDAADGVIYHYVLLCREQKIRFDVKGMLHEPGIENIDLCVLLGNALDNAVAACSAYDGERFIGLALRQEKGVLTVSVRNSFNGLILKKGDAILSSKGVNREGVGISSMKNISKKYGGDLRIKYEGNTFSLMALLNSQG